MPTPLRLHREARRGKVLQQPGQQQGDRGPDPRDPALQAKPIPASFEDDLRDHNHGDLDTAPVLQ